MLFILALVIFIILYITLALYYSQSEKPFKTKSFVINLAKNPERLERFHYFYDNSDISFIPLERVEAINGKQLDIQRYVSEHSYKTLLENEKNKFRTRHYELTRGAVGCYLSHTILYERLLEDPDVDYYFIFEDDAAVLPVIKKRLEVAISLAPSNWDMIILAPIMKMVKSSNILFDKYDTFWGLCGYIINKRGAKKFVDEFKKKPICMQIDSKMSLMILNDQLNVYGYSKDKTIWHDRTIGSDIQMPMKAQENIDPFHIEEL